MCVSIMLLLRSENDALPPKPLFASMFHCVCMPNTASRWSAVRRSNPTYSFSKQTWVHSGCCIPTNRQFEASDGFCINLSDERLTNPAADLITDARIAEPPTSAHCGNEGVSLSGTAGYINPLYFFHSSSAPPVLSFEPSSSPVLVGEYDRVAPLRFVLIDTMNLQPVLFLFAFHLFTTSFLSYDTHDYYH